MIMPNLKIAFILNVFPALSETFILNQITGLLDLGHEVDIFTIYRGNSRKVQEEIKIYNLLSRTHYPKMPTIKSWHNLKIISLIISNFHKNPGSIFRTLTVLKYRRDALGLKLLPVCFAHFRRNIYDIIHCHYGPNGNLGVLLKELGVIRGKVIATFHGYDIRRGLKHGQGIYYPIRTKGDLILSISKFNRMQLEKLGFDTSKIADHPVGIDLEKFPLLWQNRNALSQREPTKILTVARLVREKGLEYGIKSIKVLLKNNPNLHVQYNIIGNGILQEQLKECVTKLGLNGIVKFLGEMDQTGVSKQMQEAHIFLLPSIEEALPVALMEAQATGLPVVATDVGGVSEVVTDGRSGYIVPAKNPLAIASKLEYLIENPGIWPEMGNYGRRIIEDKHDIKILNKRLEEIYYDLIRDNRTIPEEIN